MVTAAQQWPRGTTDIPVAQSFFRDAPFERGEWRRMGESLGILREIFNRV